MANTLKLLDMPSEVILECISNLEAPNVNSVRETCSRLRSIVDTNPKKAYNRRRLVSSMKIESHYSFKLVWQTSLMDSKRHQLTFESGVCVREFTFAGKIILSRGTQCIGLTLEECVEKVLERAGGFSKGSIAGSLISRTLSVLQPYFKHCELITIYDCCVVDAPVEEQFRFLYSSKRVLELSEVRFIGDDPYKEDRFWAEAGWKKLHIYYKDGISISDTQLRTITGRKDLDDLVISTCKGTTPEGFRDSVQNLLCSTMICTIYCGIIGASSIWREELERKIDDESINVDTAPVGSRPGDPVRPSVTFKRYQYSSHARVVTVYTKARQPVIYAGHEMTPYLQL